MKNPKSAKDIPEIPVLEFLEKLNGQWANWVSPEMDATFEKQYQGRSVLYAMPPGTLPKIALAKMRSLIRRGLAEGCGCGCRGDFVITPEGLSFLRKSKESLIIITDET